jgi:outer membrane protein assembly complex protein YaeT
MRYVSADTVRRQTVVSLLLVAIVATACKESGTVRVRSLDFNGTRAVDAGDLRAVLATRVSSRLPWGRKAFFEKSRFDADLKRIEAFYSDRGYPDARVTAFDVKLNDEQDAVDLTLTIDEGQPVLVTALNFTSFDVVPPDRLRSLQNDSPLKVGQPRNRQQVIAARDRAVNELRELGYAYARVTTSETPGSTPKETAVTLQAEPGPLTHFGTVEIVGNTSVSARVIERQLSYRPGDLYKRSVVQSSQRRLYGMELFQFVNIEPLDQDQQNPDLRTRVTVAEGKHQRLNFGVGYGTDEKGRVDGEYHHVNFLGGARSAGAHARWSALDRGVRLDFTQPYFFQPELSLAAEGQHWLTFTPAYDSLVTGGKVAMTRRPNIRSSWAVSLTGERNVSTITPEALADPSLFDELIALGLDPTTGEQAGTLYALGFDYQISTADNPLNARRGYQLAFHAEEAGQFLPGTYNYYSLSADGRHYLPISRNLVLASRLQLGNIRAADDLPANVPFSRKYFLGGASSIRGWGRFEVSPLASGTPIGGNSMIAFSSELRTMFPGNFGGVLFVDGGNVWPTADEIRLKELRYAAGLGLRYQTPVGPLRLDWGYQLNPIPGLLVNGEEQTRRWRLHFSIGQAF